MGDGGGDGINKKRTRRVEACTLSFSCIVLSSTDLWLRICLVSQR